MPPLKELNECVPIINPGLAPWAMQKYRPYRAPLRLPYHFIILMRLPWHIFNEWAIQYIGQIFDRQNKEDSSQAITTLLKASTPNLRNLILQFTHNTFFSVYLTKNKGYTHPKISLHIPFWKLQLKSVQTTAEVCTDYTCSLHRLRRVLNFSARTQGSVYTYLPECLRVNTNIFY